MRKRVVGFVSATVLAVLGVVLLVNYVRGAEDRALEGEEVVDVLVVADHIGAGTEADTIADNIRTEQVPQKVRVDDAVTDLDELEGLVASVDLLAGEQLTRSRFVVATALTGFETSGISPEEGQLEVTIELEPQRILGGDLSADGETRVAVIASFDSFTVDVPELPDGSEPIIELDGQLFAGGNSPDSTAIILHKVLVTNVQAGEFPDDAQVDQDGRAEAPDANWMVTLSLSTPDVERLVFAQEHGRIWLAKEGEDVLEEGSRVWTRANVYQIPSALGADDGGGANVNVTVDGQ